jgi:hypothetical protein
MNKKYTKDEFIYYLRGVLDAQSKAMSGDSDDIIDLIKEAYNNLEEDQAPALNFGSNGYSIMPGCTPPVKVPYHEICRACNPKFGGSGICGCTMANELVEHPINNTIITTTSTSTEILDNNKTYLNSMQYSTSQQPNSAQSIELYTEDEVSRLLEMQRGNCYVAVLRESKSAKIASVASTAPEPGQWRKNEK